MIAPCDTCGALIDVGMWPFCPHGYGQAQIQRDEIPGGQVIETMDHEPVICYSQSEIRREADKRGLRLRDQWAGPTDKHLSNWAAAIDAKTLDDKRVLLSRRSPHREHRSTLESLRTEVNEITTIPV